MHPDSKVFHISAHAIDAYISQKSQEFTHVLERGGSAF